MSAWRGRSASRRSTDDAAYKKFNAHRRNRPWRHPRRRAAPGRRAAPAEPDPNKGQPSEKAKPAPEKSAATGIPECDKYFAAVDACIRVRPCPGRISRPPSSTSAGCARYCRLPKRRRDATSGSGARRGQPRCGAVYEQSCFERPSARAIPGGDGRDLVCAHRARLLSAARSHRFLLREQLHQLCDGLSARWHLRGWPGSCVCVWLGIVRSHRETVAAQTARLANAAGARGQVRHDRRQVGTIDAQKLSEVRRWLADARKRSLSKKAQRGADRGSIASQCWIREGSGDGYREVELAVDGDWHYRNTAPAAAELTRWLQTLVKEK